MTRDQSLVEFAAKKIMGWPPETHRAAWNPLESWADAGMLWVKVRERGVSSLMGAYESGSWAAYCTQAETPTVRVQADSGPRAITEAICAACGWEEEKS